MTLEDDLKNALHDKANRIEPAADSYVKLASRVNTSKGASRGGSDRFRFLAVAAIFVAVIGSVGFYVARDSGDDTIAAGPTTTEITLPTTTMAPPQNDATDLSDAEAPPLQGFVAGPIASTREGAALAFLEMLGVEGATVTVNGNVAEIQTDKEDGSLGAIVSYFDLVSVESKGGYAVSEARSDNVVIESPAAPKSASYDIFTDSEIAIEGEGSGFEANLVLRAISAIDGTLLDIGNATGGATDLAPFEDSLQVFGIGRAWIMVQSDGAINGVIGSFAAVPISYEAPLHPAIYTVVGVPADDPDGGLNVRNSPGVPAEADATTSTAQATGTTVPGTDPHAVVAVLKNGTSDIHRRSLIPVNLDGQKWWNIEVGEVEGWVNSRYLVDVDQQRVDDLTQLALDFEEAMSGDSTLVETLPWITKGVGYVGWYQNLLEVSAPTIATVDWWETDRPVLEPGMAESSGLITSLFKFMSSPIDDISAEIGFEMGSPYPLDLDVHAELSADYDFVTLLYEDENAAFRIVTLYVEPSADGPVIAVVATAFWIP